MTLDAAPFEVFPLFDQTLGMFVPSAERKGVSLVSDNRAEKGMYVKADAARIRQVLINLLSNAVKFTSSGSIRFGYRLTDDGIYVYVTDTGMGISKESQASIFNRFVKLNSFKQGTGLGLSICKTIIEKLKGKIGVESEEGKALHSGLRYLANR
mgnify:CR=1 FL=1